MSNRKYTFNKNFFVIDSPELFYFAGFIAADGCIIKTFRKNKYKLDNIKNCYMAISLKEEDKDHLIKLGQLADYNHPLYKRLCENSKRNSKYNDTITYTLRINSELAVSSLEKFNIGPRKSLTYEMPKWLLSHKYINHFLRGYFDGDGSVCISQYKTRTKQLQIHIRGTENFLKQFHNIIYLNLQNISKTKQDKKISKDSGIYSLQYNGNNISRCIYNFLYKNTSIQLNRKKEVFESLFNDTTIKFRIK